MESQVGSISFVPALIFYCYYSFCLMTIANKLSVPNAWLAWIPIANLYIMVTAARKEWWWMLLFLIPIVNIVLFFVIWWAIAEARNKPGWVSLLMLIPFVNLIVPGYIAFTN